MGQLSTWVAIQDKRICPDCANLHGVTKEYDEWIAGDVLPGNGKTICQEWCRCLIVPAEYAKEFDAEVELSVQTKPAEDLLAGAVDSNAVLKWAVMLEREAGYFRDPQQDLIETARVYLAGNETEKAILMEVYPLHYKLIQTLIK